MNKLIFLLGLSFLAHGASAQTELKPTKEIPGSAWWQAFKPTSLLVQHSGYAGFAAAGVGYASAEKSFAFDLLYGYTPAPLAGHDVHSLTAKSLWNFVTLNFGSPYQWRPYVGLNFIYSPHSDLFVVLPRQYPKWYYTPTALRPAFVGGMSFAWETTREIGVEWVILDSELAYLRGNDGINPRRFGSIGFSLRWNLE